MPVAKTGRPATKRGSAAKKHRDASRKEYQSLPTAKKSARVTNRSKPAQRKADAKRLASQRTKRNEYHREQAAAVADVPKPTKCSVCGGTKNVERHHYGKVVRAVCARCHARVRA